MFLDFLSVILASSCNHAGIGAYEKPCIIFLDKNTWLFYHISKQGDAYDRKGKSTD